MNNVQKCDNYINIPSSQTYRERERVRRESWGGGSVRQYRVGGGVIETEFGRLKVPRKCPLVLLVEARLVFGITNL
jgi:hypothetical protein